MSWFTDFADGCEDAFQYVTDRDGYHTKRIVTDLIVIAMRMKQPPPAECPECRRVRRMTKRPTRICRACRSR